MSTDKTHFEKDEKGIAMEKAHDLQQPFSENLDGTSYVPNENLRKKQAKKNQQKKQIKIKRR